MKSIRLIVCLLFLAIGNVYSQETFERLYTDSDYEYISLDIAHVPSGAYYVLSVVKHKDSLAYKVVNLTVLDKKGDFTGISLDYYIADSLTVIPRGSLSATNDGLIMSFISLNDNQFSNVYFKTDFNGAIQWARIQEAYTSSSVLLKGINKIHHNPISDKLVHIGSDMVGNDRDIYFNQYDEQGDIIGISTRFNYKDPADMDKVFTEQIAGITRTAHDSAYIFCGVLDSELQSDLFITKLNPITPTNPSTTVEWSYSYVLGLDNKAYAVDIIQMSDTLYVAALNSQVDSDLSQSYIIGIDSMGAPQWVTKLSYTSDHCRILELEKSSDTEFTLLVNKVNTTFGEVEMAGFDLKGKKKWEKLNKESSEWTALGGNMIKTSNQKMASILTGYDRSDIVKRPKRYIIVSELDGTTDCNIDENLLVVDTAAIFNKNLVWDLETYNAGSPIALQSKSRSVIPYTAIPEDGKVLFCPGEMINSLLIGTTEGSNNTYKWAAGAITDTMRVHDVGMFPIEVTIRDYNYCYSLCDTVTLDYFMEPTVGIEGVFSSYCVDNTILLNAIGQATTGDLLYEWSTGETVKTIKVKELGNYSVSVTDDCGQTATASILLSDQNVLPTPVIVSRLINQENPCAEGGAKYLILLNSNEFDSFEWSTGELTDTIKVLPGDYSITAKIGVSCITSVSISVEPVEDCLNPLIFPNAFVPNENAEGFDKDRFFAPFNASGDDILTYSLIIVNRWGQVLFESDDYTKGWNGIYKGKLSISGTYFFKAVYTTSLESYEDKGGFVLVK